MAAYSYTEIATLLSRVLGKDIAYEQEDIRRIVEMMGAGGNVHLEKHFAATLLDYDIGIFEGTGNLVPHITGKPQITLEHFIESHRAEFL